MDGGETLKKLLIATQECEALYTSVLDDAQNANILPKFALSLVQQHLYPDSTYNQAICEVLRSRLEQITNREICVLVAGDVSSGKSTIVNILMGGDYLPMSRGKTTNVVCELRHDHEKRAVMKFEAKGEADKQITLSADSQHESWKDLRSFIRSKSVDGRKLNRVIIYWPLAIIKNRKMPSLVKKTPLSIPSRSGSQPIQTAPPARVIPFPSDREPPEGSSMDFDEPFMQVLKQPYASSYRGHSSEETVRDTSQTLPKQPYTDSDNTNRKQVVSTLASDGSGEVIYDSIEREHIETTDSLGNKQNGNKRSESVTKRTQTHDKTEGKTGDDMDKLRDEDSGCGGIVNIADISESDMDDTGTGHDDGANNDARVMVDTAMLDDDGGSLNSGAEEPDSMDPTGERGGDEWQDMFRFVFLDCPGITGSSDENSFQPVMDCVARCRSFIFVIDVLIDHGVEEHRLQRLLEQIKTLQESQNINISTEAALFIANKAEDLPPDYDEDEVLSRLRKKWPLIDNCQLVRLQANKVLEELQRGQYESRDAIYRTVGKFIDQSVRLSLEEHCLWLLNMLELSHAIAKTGKQWAALSKTRFSLNETLKRATIDANILHEMITERKDDDIRKKSLQQLEAILEQRIPDPNDPAMVEIWQAIAGRISKPNNCNWNEIMEDIDKQICEEISKGFAYDIETLKTNHKSKIRERFKKEHEMLEKIKRGLQRIDDDRSSTSPSVGTQAAVSILAPVVASLGVRIAPHMFPFVFLLAPLLPVPLLFYSLFEEYQQMKNDSERTEFEADKDAFIAKRAETVLGKLKQAFTRTSLMDHSALFLSIFGESEKKILHAEVEQLLEAICYLSELTEKSMTASVENQKCSKQHMLHVWQLYGEHVISHEISPRDLNITRDTEGQYVKIGCGGHATVWKGFFQVSRHTLVPVAVKEIRFRGDVDGQGSASLPPNSDLYRECLLMRQLSRKPRVDEYMVKYYGSCCNGDLGLRLVIELCDGNLRLVTANRNTLGGTESERKSEFFYYAGEVTKGVKFLHDNGVIHRDVKPENFLLKSRGPGNGRYRVLISDVGSSKQEELICSIGRNHGTYAYWAPEVSRNELHSRPADMFSLGLVLWELWFRKVARDSMIEGRVPAEIAKVDSVQYVIGSCLKSRPRDRISAQRLWNIIANESC